MKQFFAPMVSRDAAIRIDPVVTVNDYDYPDIQEAARQLKTKTYIVFIEEVRVLFMVNPA